MKNVLLVSLLASTLGLVACGPADDPAARARLGSSRAGMTVELWEIPVSSELQAAAQATLPYCSNCTGLNVWAFEVNDPPTGHIPEVDAGYAALDALQLSQLGYGYYTTLSRDQTGSYLWRPQGAPLVPEAEGFTGSTSYASSMYWYEYMTAPDYCDNGRFFALVFQDTRQVVAVEYTYGQDC